MTTVGYGDVVPESGAGRIVAVFVMAFGVTAVSLTTAVVTAEFVARAQGRREDAGGGEDPAVHESLARIERRLESLESHFLG